MVASFAMKTLPTLALATLLGASAAFAAPAATSNLPWIEDDYGRAVAEAKARHVPIFLEAWAPW